MLLLIAVCWLVMVACCLLCDRCSLWVVCSLLVLLSMLFAVVCCLLCDNWCVLLNACGWCCYSLLALLFEVLCLLAVLWHSVCDYQRF